jgi:hypothetical protein
MYACSGPIVSPALQRRVHKRFEHGLLALLAIAACAGLALMAARPLPAASAAEPTGAPASALPDATMTADEPTPARKRNAIRRSRQTLAMPYFSFAAGN